MLALSSFMWPPLMITNTPPVSQEHFFPPPRHVTNVYNGRFNHIRTGRPTNADSPKWKWKHLFINARNYEAIWPSICCVKLLKFLSQEGLSDVAAWERAAGIVLDRRLRTAAFKLALDWWRKKVQPLEYIYLKSQRGGRLLIRIKMQVALQAHI